jgi:hypothetical protein
MENISAIIDDELSSVQRTCSKAHLPLPFVTVIATAQNQKRGNLNTTTIV